MSKIPFKQNLHTHTVFCDGKNTPEELVQEAIARGFDSLGFSMHSYVPCSGIGSIGALESYRNEISHLKVKYTDSIKIYLGIEYDICSSHNVQGYDYTIASVHCLSKNGTVFDFDGSLDRIKYIMDYYYHGNSMEFARAYYESVASIPQYGQFDILGHFDLITKNNERGKFLDVDSEEYKSFAIDAIHALKGKVPLFEVNTGCIARGYRCMPYPAVTLLQEFKNCGFGAVISSDCHQKEYLDIHYNEAKDLLESVGFRSIYILTDQGFQEMPLI